MANKMINELSAGAITSQNDVFVFQTAGGETKKISWSEFVSRLASTDILAGSNVTKETVADTNGTHLRLSASDTTYTAGSAIDIINDVISVDTTELANTVISSSSDMGGSFLFQKSDGVLYKLQLGNLIVPIITGHIAAGDNVTIAYQTSDIGAPKAVISADPTATIAVGTVTTGDAGTSASVTNSGTNSNAVFDFVIPRGADGARGDNGTNGTDGHSISAAETSIANGHRVTISSTDPEVSDITFDLTNGVTTIQTTSANITVSLPAASWTGDSAPYTQTVTVTGITASTAPILDVSVSDTVADGLEQKKQWGYISKAVTAENSITFSCYEKKPTVDLTVNVKVV